MKQCLLCDKTYEDEYKYCPLCASPLIAKKNISTEDLIDCIKECHLRICGEERYTLNEFDMIRKAVYGIFTIAADAMRIEREKLGLTSPPSRIVNKLKGKIISNNNDIFHTMGSSYENDIRNTTLDFRLICTLSDVFYDYMNEVIIEPKSKIWRIIMIDYLFHFKRLVRGIPEEYQYYINHANFDSFVKEHYPPWYFISSDNLDPEDWVAFMLATQFKDDEDEPEESEEFEFPF